MPLLNVLRFAVNNILEGFLKTSSLDKGQGEAEVTNIGTPNEDIRYNRQ